jgi:hypothetical protein
MKRQLKHGDIITVSLTAVKLRFEEYGHGDPGHVYGEHYGHLELVDPITDMIEQDRVIVHPEGGQLGNGGILATNKVDGTLNPGPDTDLDGGSDSRFIFVYSVRKCFLCSFTSDDPEKLQEHFDTVHI